MKNTALTWASECAARVRPHVLALAGYAVVALLFAWPLPLHFQTHLPGSPDGDTGVYVWNLWVFQHELLDHRMMPYFTGEIFGGTGRANLSLHNYTAFANVLALPFVRVVGLVATFNIVYLLLTTLAAYAAFLLARHFTRDAPVAWLAGLLFAWSPMLVTRGMGHFSLVAAAPLPIFVLLVSRSAERRSLLDGVAMGATVAWATACDVYYGVFCVMLATVYLSATSVRLMCSERTLTPAGVALVRTLDIVAISLAGLVLALLVSQGWEFTLMGRVVRIRTIYTPVLILTLLIGLRVAVYYRPGLREVSLERISASVRILATAGIVSAILMAPLLYAFSLRVLESGVDRATIFWRSSPPGLDVLALVTPNPNHPLAPDAIRDWIAGLTRDGYLENVASIPVVALIVLIAARALGWRPPIFAAAIAIGFGLLALGPFVRIGGFDTHVPGPWSLLRYLPIVGLARSPGRFFVFAMLGVAVLFASALHALLARWPGARRPLLASTALLLLAELLPAPRPIFAADVPSIYRIVADDPRESVRVLELPFGIRDGTMAIGNFTSRTQFYQTAHGKPIIGGYLSRVSRGRLGAVERDPVLGALTRLSEGKPLESAQAAQLLREWPAFIKRTAVGYVVLDRTRASEELQALATTSLHLEPLAEAGSLVLLRPSN